MSTYLQSLFSLEGKTVLVTGGGRGIGRVVAHGLAKAGAEVVIFARSDYQKTIDLIEADGGKVYGFVVDVTDETRVKAAIQETVKHSGKIDVVFNNAGIYNLGSAFNETTEDFRRMLDIHLTGQYIVARETARLMVEQGVHGSIINMASMSGSIVNYPQRQASYNAAKAAVIHLTKSLAVEWAPYQIRVNSLSPGYIATESYGSNPQEWIDTWVSLTPMRRLGKPEELVTAILYLASDASSYTSGSDVIVDGAYTCC